MRSLFVIQSYRSVVLCSLLTAAGAVAAPVAAHPRLYLTPERIIRLRQEVTTFRKPHWDAIRIHADQLARQHPPVYEVAVKTLDKDQLWQRNVGNTMPILAMAWVVTGDRKYLASLEEWMKAAAEYPLWGPLRREGAKLPAGQPTYGLPAGHELYGLAIAFDWAYHDLDPAVREAAHGALLRHGRMMYRATDPETGEFWRSSYLGNHLWITMGALTAAALAMPEEPETKQWLAVARDKFRRTEDLMGSDGASPEGVGYWGYGVEYQLKFWALSEDLLGENLRSPWWSKTALYRLYMSIPRAAWEPRKTVVDIGDCFGYDWNGPDYMLFNLAHRFRDGHAQWLALELEKAGATRSDAWFLNLLWFDPEVQPVPPAGLPLTHHFKDMDIVSTRTDWSGKESLVIFKCGPLAGHDALGKKIPEDPGLDHVHPDANAFLVFANGEWLIRDDGYAWKLTGHHNTLLVDGLGQNGENHQFLRPKWPLPPQGQPGIRIVESNPRFDFMEGEAAGAYVPAAGLRRYSRKLIFWKPSILLVIDDVETDRPRELELRFHPAENGKVRIQNLTPAGVSTTEGAIDGKDRAAKPMPQFTVRMRTMAARWHNVVAISWPNRYGPGQSVEAAIVRMEVTGDALRFESGGKALTYSRKTARVTN